MKPRIYSSDTLKFNSGGLGTLRNVIECTVTEELGVAPTLEMSILMNDPLFKNIIVGNIIGIKPNKTTELQAFVIEEITKPLDGVVTIYATHIAQHRGKLIPVAPFTANTLDDALAAMVTNSLENNPFTLVRDANKNNVQAVMSPTVPHSFCELMGGVSGSVLDTYRGEWSYNNFIITLYNKRGHDNGVTVMYGRNMSNFELDEQFNWNNSATGVIGYWVSREDGTTVIGDIQYSSNRELYPYNKTVCLDLTDKFESQPTVSEINTYAATWINGKGLYGASVDVKFENLAVTGNVDIELGDTVHIINPQYDFDFESRIVGLEFDALAEQYTNISIGEIKTTLNEAIAGVTAASDAGASSGGGGGGGSGGGVTYFLDKTVTSWTTDTTYPLYPCRGFISITGVSSADGVEVAFSDEDADSGNYSPICQSTTDGVYIWAKAQPQSLVIPTIAIGVNDDVDLHGEAPYLSTEHGGTVDGDVTFNDIIYSHRDGASLVSDQQAIDTQTAPSSTLWKNVVLVRDKNESEVGNIMAVQYADKTSGVHFESAKMVNGVRKSHAMRILLDANGNDVVQLSQAAWLKALGLNVTVVTPTLTATSNFSLVQSAVYKMGKFVYGSIILQCTADWSSGVVLSLNNTLPAYIFALCGVTNGQWAYTVAKTVRAYIPTSGNLTINTSITSGQYVTIPIAITVN